MADPISIKISDSSLNEHFATVGPKLAAKIPGKSKIDHMAVSECKDKNDNIDKCKFHLDPVSEEYIFKQLKSLSESRATGTDEIPSKLLKIACSNIVAPITHITNRFILSSVFPDKWKSARISPIFKNGDSSDVNNYRPISTLSYWKGVYLISCILFLIQRVLFTISNQVFDQNTPYVLHW